MHGLIAHLRVRLTGFVQKHFTMLFALIPIFLGFFGHIASAGFHWLHFFISRWATMFSEVNAGSSSGDSLLSTFLK